MTTKTEVLQKDQFSLHALQNQVRSRAAPSLHCAWLLSAPNASVEPLLTAGARRVDGAGGAARRRLLPAGTRAAAERLHALPHARHLRPGAARRRRVQPTQMRTGAVSMKCQNIQGFITKYIEGLKTKLQRANSASPLTIIFSCNGMWRL